MLLSIFNGYEHDKRMIRNTKNRIKTQILSRYLSLFSSTTADASIYPFRFPIKGIREIAIFSLQLSLQILFILGCHKGQREETWSTCLIISCTIYQNIFPAGHHTL